MSRIRTVITIALLFIAALPSMANIDVTGLGGWFESGYVAWTPQKGVAYTVEVRKEGGVYKILDAQLVRNYGTYYRADAVGISAGNYQFRITSSDGESMETKMFPVASHDRSGFAHVGMPDGIGAYRNDGTLKEGAKVLYVHAGNARTVSTTVQTGSGGKTAECVGLQTILDAYQKGYDQTPLDIRLIGCLKKADLDKISSSAEGLQIKGRNSFAGMPITFEGIGDDACVWGFGFNIRNCRGVELRNFAVMLCMDDAVSLDTDNSNVWLHNMDFFYGNAGSDSDQEKGDGTVDVKAGTKNVTLSYCHFYDTGKSSLGGMNEAVTQWNTYHHNWFDHSDSRHPRIRTQFFHVYNNYFDGVSKYGIGATCGGSAFVENNYFRNCKYPMLISRQGTDAEGDGTFSGEDGGVIKAYNNIVVNARKVQYYDGIQTDGAWDAVLAAARDEELTATAYVGGTPYNNDADKAARSTYVESRIDAASDVVAVVTGVLGAGRMNHGDFSWRFDNSVQDENYDVIKDLKEALQNYRSTLIGLADGTEIGNGGAAATVNGGDGKYVSDSENNSYVPSWASGGNTDTRKESDLRVLTDGISLVAGSTYTLTEDIDYATSSVGEIAFVPDNDNIVKVNTAGMISAMSAGTTQVNLYQTADNSYKKGFAAVKVTVKDGRGESAFALLSDNAVTLKEGETSQIKVTGEAGEVNYMSDNDKVASVDASGLIKAVGAGSANISVTDAGNEKIKPSEIKIKITVTRDMSGKTIVKFANVSGSPAASDPSLVTFNASTNCKNTSYSNGSETYSTGIKLESNTEIYLTPAADAKATLIFDAAFTDFKLDGTSVKTDAVGEYAFNVKGGIKYTLTKGKPMNLYAVIYDFSHTGEGGGSDSGDTPDHSPDGVSEIDFPTSMNGITLKGTTTAAGNAIQLKNGYVGGADATKTIGNGILLQVKGGFMKGDVITFSGNISVKESDAKYETKVVTTAKLVEADGVTETVTDIYEFAPVYNTVTQKGEDGDQSYVLENDYGQLWLVRSGGTTLNITKITLTRGSKLGIESVETGGKYILHDIAGRRLVTPASGQIYIANGKKYVSK